MSNVQVLLINDVEYLGRSGDLVAVRPGYFRNKLAPQRLGVRATKATLRMQARLQQERAEQAARDLAEAQDLVKRLELIELKTEVKVDQEGSMYGSVSAHDIVRLLAEKGIEIEKRFVHLAHGIKELGVHHVALKLKEGVQTQVLLKILPEGVSEEQFFGALAEQQEIQADPMYQDYYAERG
jgi:large subunit ribosomal protein L9